MIELLYQIQDINRQLKRLAGTVALFTDLVVSAIQDHSALEARVTKLEKALEEKGQKE